MSNDNHKGTDSAPMDELRTKAIPAFGPKAGPKLDAASDATAKPAGVINVDKADLAPGKMRIIQGGKSLGAEEFSARRLTETEVSGRVTGGAKIEATSGTTKASASVGVSAEASVKSTTVEGIAAGGPDQVSLAAAAKLVLEQYGLDMEKLKDADAETRELMEKRIQEVAAQLQAGFKAERTEVKAGASLGVQAGMSSDGATWGKASLAGEVMASASAVVGGLASLAGGSVSAIGAAAGALGRGLAGLKSQPAATPFNGVAVLPTISEYRVQKVEEPVTAYERAQENFWKVPAMAELRKQIEARARETGLSVSDAMEKMKPGGEWADMHAEFDRRVRASPDAMGAKVAMDAAIKSFIRQNGRAREELLTADVDENPQHKKAKQRVAEAEDKMQEMAAQTPIFGGESESHSNRLKEALQAILERLREIAAAVRERVFGSGVPHAANP